MRKAMRGMPSSHPHHACLLFLIALALSGCRSPRETESPAAPLQVQAGTPNIILGITLVPIDPFPSDANGIPRGQGWLVFDVRGSKPNVRIPETASLSEQMRLANVAAKLIEDDAISGHSKWSVHGEGGRLSVADMILSVDGQPVGPGVNDGNNMVGRALTGRLPGYRYKVEGLRWTSRALEPDKFVAWFVVPSVSESEVGTPSSNSQQAPRTTQQESNERNTTSDSNRRMWDPND